MLASRRHSVTGVGILCAMLFFTADGLPGQETGAVSGTVLEEGSNQPVAGAQVFLPGLDVGQLTNDNGRFTLREVPVGEHTISVQVIGYQGAEQTVNVSAGETASVQFVLSTRALEMEELVVTGTGGPTSKRQLGNTVSSIDAGDVVEGGSIGSMSELLGGRSAGVNVHFNSGTLGSGGTIRIRGTSSVALSGDPVIYIDGVRVDGSASSEISLGGQDISRLQDLNPSEIERVEVVKGAAAATLYGTQGSNGVVQIFTKEGRAGETQWSFETRQGFERLPTDTFPGRMFTEFVNPDNGFRARDPKQEVRSGHHQKYSGSVRGGGESIRYYFNANFEDAEGSVTPRVMWNKKASGRTNLNISPAPTLGIDINFASVFNQLRVPEGDNGLHGVYSSLDVGVPYRARPDLPYGERFGCFECVQENKKIQTVLRTTTGLTLRHNPTDALSQRFTFGIDWYNSEFTDFFPFDYSGCCEEDGAKEISSTRFQDVTVDYQATLSSDITEDIESTLTVGTQGNFTNRVQTRSEGDGFPAPGVSLVASTAVTQGTETRVQEINAGVFAQERLGFWNRLYLNAGIRADGNSAFGNEFQVQYYPKGSVAYNISEESFWPSDFWPSMKFRVAYGRSGLAPAQFAADRTFEPVSGKEGQSAVTPGNRGNPELGPETSEEFEVGFDAGLWQDRLGIEFTAFRQQTSDALIDKQFPPSEGFLSTQQTNIGEIKNEGIETSLEAVLVQAEDIRWSTNVNVTWRDNEVTDMGGIGEISAGGISGVRVREGYPVHGIWGYEMEAWDPQARTHIPSDTVVFMGQSVAPWYGGLSTTFSFDRFTVRGMAQFEAGHHKTNFSRWWNTRIRTGDHYLSLVEKPHGEPTPAADSLVNFVQTIGTQAYVSPRDFLSLRELSLTYQVPQGWVSRFDVERASIQISGRQLMVWDAYDGISPETEWNGHASIDRGGEFNTIPPARRFFVTVRTSF